MKLEGQQQIGLSGSGLESVEEARGPAPEIKERWEIHGGGGPCGPASEMAHWDPSPLGSRSNVDEFPKCMKDIKQNSGSTMGPKKNMHSPGTWEQDVKLLKIQI